MSQRITCPHCSNQIEISEVMSAQLAAKIRADFEAEYSEKTRKLSAQREELLRQQKKVEEQVEEVDQRVREAVGKERQAIETKARVTAQQAVAVEIEDREQQLKVTAQKLKEAQSKELDLRKKQRELQEREEQQELEFQRQLDKERKSIRDSAFKQAWNEVELKQLENTQIINGLRKQIDELKQKAEQGSQQAQGEVLEIALENVLKEAFPMDNIQPVAKGVRGGDLLHTVVDSSGKECGSILWETKRTLNWSQKWLSKLIDDQQNAKATCACIISSALPEEIDHFDQLNGIWVASWPCARSVAIVLRAMLIEANQARLATEGQHGKMELVYNYLSGPEFKNRIRGLLEPYKEMQADLEAEKKAFNRHWNKRQKQLDRALMSTTGMYGDLQGIVGKGLQEIEGMDALALESQMDGQRALPR